MNGKKCRSGSRRVILLSLLSVLPYKISNMSNNGSRPIRGVFGQPDMSL